MLWKTAAVFLYLFKFYVLTEAPIDIFFTDESIYSMFTLLPSMLNSAASLCNPSTMLMGRKFDSTVLVLSAENFCVKSISIESMVLKKPILLSKHKMQLITPGINIVGGYLQVIDINKELTKIYVDVNIKNYQLKTDIEFFYARDGKMMVQLDNTKAIFDSIDFDIHDFWYNVLYRMINSDNLKMMIIESVLQPTINYFLASLDLRSLQNVKIGENTINMGLHELPSFYKKDNQSIYNISVGLNIENNQETLEHNIREREKRIYSAIQVPNNPADHLKNIDDKTLGKIFSKLLL